MKQARSEARKLARAQRKEKAVELQCAIEDRRAAQALMRELAELERSCTRWTARMKAMVRPEKPAARTSPVRKRVTRAVKSASVSRLALTSRASSWAIDDKGMRGIIWQQSYLRRGTDAFHPGAAREFWDYVARDEAVLLDAGGEPVIIKNMGDDWGEIGFAWQAMEDASTRKNAKIQMRVVVPLDADMSREEMFAAVEHFCETILKPLGLPYSAVIHRPPADGDDRNFHAHILFALRPMRRVEPYCWEVADGVCGALDGTDGVQTLRHLWAHSMTEAAERAQSNRAYTGLGYGARALDLDAGEHLGEARSAMVRRGATVWAHERNRIKAARNAARLAIRDADRKIVALTKVRDAALARIGDDQMVDGKARILTPSGPCARATTLAAAMPSGRDLVHLIPADRTIPMPEQRTASHMPPPRLERQVSSAAKDPIRSRSITPSRSPAMPEPLSASRPFGAPSSRLLPSAHVPVARRSLVSAAAPGKPKTPLVPASPAVANGVFGRQIHEMLRLIADTRIARGRRAAARKVEHQRSAIVVPSANTPPVARTHSSRRTVRPAVQRLPIRSDESSPLTIAALPRRDRLEADALARSAAAAPAADPVDRALLDRLVVQDPYVMAYDDGVLEITSGARKALGVDAAWIGLPPIQQALAHMRTDQQLVMEALAREIESRPLDFTPSGARFWPRDLDPAHLRRLDTWASDPGFEQEIVPAELLVHRAHDDRRRQGTRPDGPERHGAARLDRPTADGFGGKPVPDSGLGRTR